MPLSKLRYRGPKGDAGDAGEGGSPTTLGLRTIIRFQISSTVAIKNIPANVTSVAAPFDLQGIHVLQVTFPSPWTGGNVAVTIRDRFGTSRTRTFTASAGNTVVDTMPAAAVTAVTLAGGGNGAHVATLEIASILCLPHAPILGVHGCYVSGADLPFFNVDLVNGTFDIGGVVNAGDYDTQFTVSV